MITPEPTTGLVQTLVSAFPLKIIKSPTLHEVLDNEYPHYPFPKTFATARKEPLVVVHTSGTTAVPKPIIYTHDFGASYIQQAQLEPPPGFESQTALIQANCLFVTLPFFHVGLLLSEVLIAVDATPLTRLQAGNLFASLLDAIANQTTIITPLAGIPPSAEVIVEGIKRSKADAAVIAAPFVDQIAKCPDLLDVVTDNLDSITYAGGDISPKAGNAFAFKTKVSCGIGATESGLYPSIRPSGEYPHQDWKYIHPHPVAGLHFRPAFDDLFEAFIVKNTQYEDHHPVFRIFPHLEEFHTKDLYRPHPLKPNLWAYHGRADDVIAFKTGFLCHPTAMEQHVSHHPKVHSALMGGTNRYQSMLLIEPESSNDRALTEDEQISLIEQIYPTVEEANQGYKADQRVAKTHILFTSPERPVKRAGKGTIQRIPTLMIYDEAINDLYNRKGDVMLNSQSFKSH